ncbi:Glycine--tRNA ligase protein [Dioscorea alata]|uniref:Glycine--tRNA ligase protein n=1 Tax=Dioscorea alata TaxID=55571 RepID=A0ACB7UCC7_DIOAL|nr:Glycine--tRNA ligase protein [Dioscorea alata]
MSPTSFYIFGLFMLCRGWITSRKLGMLMELLMASYFWRMSVLYIKQQVGVDPREFVLEIGTEEIPPGDIIDASEQVCCLIIVYRMLSTNVYLAYVDNNFLYI